MKINTMSDLIKDLSEAYESLREGKLLIEDAKEISNLSGKLIKGASTQLKYNQYMKSTQEIPFLRSEEFVLPLKKDEDEIQA